MSAAPGGTRAQEGRWAAGRRRACTRTAHAAALGAGFPYSAPPDVGAQTRKLEPSGTRALEGAARNRGDPGGRAEPPGARALPMPLHSAAVSRARRHDMSEPRPQNWSRVGRGAFEEAAQNRRACLRGRPTVGWFLVSPGADAADLVGGLATLDGMTERQLSRGFGGVDQHGRRRSRRAPHNNPYHYHRRANRPETLHVHGAHVRRRQVHAKGMNPGVATAG